MQLRRSSLASTRPDPAALLPGQPAVNINQVEPGLYFADNSGNLFKVGPCHIGASEPNLGTPNCVGEQWYDPNYGLMTWDGSSWLPPVSPASAPLIGGITVNGTTFEKLETVTASTGTYTLNVSSANNFSTSSAIASATVINLGNLVEIPNGYVWKGSLTFAYTSGTISWFTGNTGYTVKWDGGTEIVPTAGQTEKVLIEVTGGLTTIEVTALSGRP